MVVNVAQHIRCAILLQRVAAPFSAVRLWADCIRYKQRAASLFLADGIFLGKLDADVTVGGEAPYFVTFSIRGLSRRKMPKKGNAVIETMEVNVGRHPNDNPKTPFSGGQSDRPILTKSEIIVCGRARDQNRRRIFALAPAACPMR